MAATTTEEGACPSRRRRPLTATTDTNASANGDTVERTVHKVRRWIHGDVNEMPRSHMLVTFSPVTAVKFPDATTAATFSGDGYASFVDSSDDDASGVSFEFSVVGKEGKNGGGGGILLRKGDFALEMTEDGAALETVLYMEEDSIRVPKRLAALSADAALENGGRHAVEIAIEGIELVIRVDGAKHTMTPVRPIFGVSTGLSLSDSIGLANLFN